MVLTLKSGGTTTTLTPQQQHCTTSVLLNTLDEEGEEDVVQLPPFIEQHLPRIPSLLDNLVVNTTPGACFPELTREDTGRHVRFAQAVAWLKTCQFLDIEAAVEMLFQHLRQRLAECRTVDALVELMYGDEAWTALGWEQQRICYHVLFKNFTTLTEQGEVSGVHPRVPDLE